MNRIKVLPSEISVKIAAGEVIERPGSVVKEMVENSLDAGATEINVELLEGGKGLIRVTDNGHGMNPEDAEVCFKRHSTSKIDKEEDLNHISTLGFRGEALPSISAVSRITLRTNVEGSDRGIEVRREGEEVLSVSDIAFPKGTSFEVKDLFFNLPARKKFLRSERSELTFTAKYLTNAALANPEVRFSLKNGRREIFNYPEVSSLKERLFQVYGKASVDNLMEVDYRDREYHLFGFASVPPSGRSDRTRQMFYVNKRPVRDKTLQAAFNQAYRGFLEKDRFAEAYLFLTVPYSDVDVNVHPTKADVRFQESRPLFQFIYKSIHHALLSRKGIKEVYSPSVEQVPSQGIKERPHSRGFQFSPADLLEEGQGDLSTDTPTLFPAEGEEQRDFPRVLGQYQDAYIVAVDPEAVFIIDQHNAHERVLFQEFLYITSKGEWPRKLALLTILFEFSPSQELAWEENQSFLEEMGFRIEPMGGKSFALKEYPEMFRDEEARDVFLSILEDVTKEKVEQKRERILATMACKAAIKYGEKLTQDKMDYLVEELFRTENPSLCPHGRPIVVKLTNKEIEKSLKRG